MINFEDGTLEKGAYVVIDGKEYEVHMPKYSGNTPLSSENLNKLQSDIINNNIPTKISTGQEVATNEYIDNKQVYVKRIDCGNMPNATTKNIETGINLQQIKVVRLDGICQNNDGTVFTIPFYRGTDEFSFKMWIQSNKIVIETGSDRSDFNGYVDIYYTKN